MSSASFYKWRAKFGGMDATMMANHGRHIQKALMSSGIGDVGHPALVGRATSNCHCK